MKICFLADGQSVHTERWCQYFLSAGHEVHLITLRNTDLDGVHFHFIDAGNIASAGGNWKIIFKFRKVKSLVKKIKPDILHAHYASSYGLLGALAGYHPYVITAMGTDVLITAFQSVLYKMIIKFSLKKADWITSMADHMTEKLIILGVPREKISKVIFGIDDKIFSSVHHQPPADKFVITSTRYFEPIYNLPLIFKAVKIVKDKIPGLTVNMIGAGSLRKSFEDLVNELEINDVVHFTGRLPFEDLVKTLNQTHVYVTVSLSDGNSVSLMEAMACGAFIIASDIPPNKPWISDGVNGFVVPVDSPEILAEKILFVYQNYSALELSCIAYNDKIISEQAIWSKNMAEVEKKYLSLLK